MQLSKVSIPSPVTAPPRYYKLRWTAPYRFAMVAAGARAFPGCDVADPAPDPVATLFPIAGARP